MATRIFFAFLICALSGCAGTKAGIVGDSRAKEITIDGELIVVSPIEGNVWGAALKLKRWSPTIVPIVKSRYIKAVEAISGCTVIDTDYDQLDDRLQASVKCP